jgi:hypothetical protein
MEWYDLSTERKIQWMLSHGDRKWGWVIYRCTYKPGFDSHWDAFKRRLNKKMCEDIAKSDAPDIADKMDWVVIEDPSLEGASLDELRRRFREWARAGNEGHSNFDVDNPGEGACRGSRYTYFIQVDEGIANGQVNIVRAWPYPSPPEDMEEAEADHQPGKADDMDEEGWMKMRADMVDPYFYVELDNDENWYAYYTPPPGVCKW